MVQTIDQALKCILDHLWFVHYEHSPWDNISHDIHKHFQMKNITKTNNNNNNNNNKVIKKNFDYPKPKANSP